MSHCFTLVDTVHLPLLNRVSVASLLLFRRYAPNGMTASVRKVKYSRLSAL